MMSSLFHYRHRRSSSNVADHVAIAGLFALKDNFLKAHAEKGIPYGAVVKEQFGVKPSSQLTP